MKETVKKNAR